MSEFSEQDLALWLLREVADGSLSRTDVTAFLAAFFPNTETNETVLAALLDRLDGVHSGRALELRRRLLELRLGKLHAMHASGGASSTAAAAELVDMPDRVPPPWQPPMELEGALRRVIAALQARIWLRRYAPELTAAAARLEQDLRQARERFDAIGGRWAYLPISLDASAPDSLRPAIDACREARQAETPTGAVVTDVAGPADTRLLRVIADRLSQPNLSRTERRALLNRLLTWSDPIASASIINCCESAADREHATALLALRFGRVITADWSQVHAWLYTCSQAAQAERERLRPLAERGRYELTWLYLQDAPNPPAGAVAETESAIADQLPTDMRRTLAERLRGQIPAAELQALGGVAPEPAAPPPPVIQAIPEVEPEPQPAPAAPVAAAPKPPPEPTLWQTQLQPFLLANWYMFAGLLMVLVGASLVAYFSWSNLLLRYTLVPGLLMGFTYAIAAIGTWMERREEALAGTAAMLRGGAIVLLPVNLMTLPLLAGDAQLSDGLRLAGVAAGGLLYVALIGVGLWRWCGQVEPALRRSLAPPLLATNLILLLAAVIPLVDAVDASLLPIGFYAAAVVTAWCLRLFLRDSLSEELVDGRRVPWFFGATLAISVSVVFLLAHWALQTPPRPAHFGALAVLIGAFVLQAERRVLELRGQPDGLGGESFIGFAAILLGVVLAAASPPWRILTMLLAGFIWAVQAEFRRGLAHHWIALLLAALGLASIGALPDFPRGQALAAGGRAFNALGLLGLAIAGAVGLLRVLSRRRADQRLSEAAGEFQAAVLILTAVAAVLSQWLTVSAPIWTAAVLLATALVFGWRAQRLERLAWLHTSVALAALALPYLGCADMVERTLVGSTLVFGLAVLAVVWLLLAGLLRTELLLAARSSVLWGLGALAVAAMLVRLVAEITPAEPPALWRLLDQGGPILMAVCLGLGAWYSRSLIPGGLAAIILAVLLPELKAQYPDTFEALGWGSGLGSACSAAGLLAIAFLLRRRLPASMPGGDRFLGIMDFPLRREDHSLFTWPLLGTVAFLVAKLLLLTGPGHVLHATVTWHVAIGLVLAAAVLIALSVYLRREPHGSWPAAVGWLPLLVGTHYLAWLARPELHERALDVRYLIVPLLTLQVLYLAYRLLARRYDWLTALLAEPLARFMAVLSVPLALLTITVTLVDAGLQRTWPLWLFLVLHLAWQEWHRRDYWTGALSAALLGLLGPLLGLRAAWGDERAMLDALADSSSPATVWLLIVAAVHAVLLALEWRGNRDATTPRLPSLLRCYQVTAYVLAWGLALTALVDAVELRDAMPIWQSAAVLALLALVIRAEHSASLLLAFLGVGYCFIIELADLPTWHVVMPMYVGLLALVTALTGLASRSLYETWPRLARGGLPLLRLNAPRRWALLVPAQLLALIACLGSLVGTVAQDGWEHLTGASLAALTFLVCAFAGAFVYHVVMAVLAMGLANLLTAAYAYVHFDLGELGLTPLHALAAAAVMTALQAWVVLPALRWITQEAADPEALERSEPGLVSRWMQAASDTLRFRQRGLRVTVDVVTVVGAGIGLLLLALNYLLQPPLMAMTWQRLAVSGALAGLAALCLRGAARRTDDDGAGSSRGRWLEAGYHAGLTLTVWCLALLIPPLRRPELAMPALALAPLVFYLRAAWHRHRGDTARELMLRNSHSAAILAAALIAVYAFRAAADMALFPTETPSLQSYHWGAPVVLLLGLLLVRLHAYGGDYWLALYGGLAVMTGGYFLLSWLPGLSLFTHPQAGAWVAIALAHLYILISHQRSPLRTAIERLGELGTDQWHDLRVGWGVYLQASVQAAMIAACLQARENPQQVALLLAGAGTVALHQVIAGGYRVYGALAGLELLLALHADFLPATPSYLPADAVIWVLLGLWAALLVSRPWTRRWLDALTLSRAAAGVAALVGLHLLYHHPESGVGLAAAGLLWLLALATPVPSAAAQSTAGRIAAYLPVLGPCWLAYFSATDMRTLGLDGVFPIPALLLLAWALLAMAAIARQVHRQQPELGHTAIGGPWLLHRSWQLMRQHGDRDHRILLHLAIIAAAGSIVMQQWQAMGAGWLTAALAFWLILARLYFVAADQSRSYPLQALWQAALLGFYLTARQEIALTTELWRPDYDVWSALAASTLIAGLRRPVRDRIPELRYTLVFTLCILPAWALYWIVVHDLGPDLALVVLGLQAALFAYMGGNRPDSPFHAAAVGGAVAFVLLLFWARLDLRVLQAYVIPVGLGVLALLQLFGRHLDPTKRNTVRLITVLAMIGSAAFYAIVDDRHPVGFNLTMIVLCLAAMGLGGLLRVRVYVVLGFAGLVIDLASIVYKVVITFERALQMASIGTLLLVLGAAVVGGTAWYRTHRDSIDRHVQSWRNRLQAWE